MCHLYDWIRYWWSCPVLAMYAYLPYRMYWRLVNAKFYMSFLYGASGRRPPCHLWNQLILWLHHREGKKLVKSDKEKNDIDDKSRSDLVRMRALNNKHGRMFSVRLLQIIRFSFIKGFKILEESSFRYLLTPTFFSCLKTFRFEICTSHNH